MSSEKADYICSSKWWN